MVKLTTDSLDTQLVVTSFSNITIYGHKIMQLTFVGQGNCTVRTCLHVCVPGHGM